MEADISDDVVIYCSFGLRVVWNDDEAFRPSPQLSKPPSPYP